MTTALAGGVTAVWLLAAPPAIASTRLPGALSAGSAADAPDSPATDPVTFPAADLLVGSVALRHLDLDTAAPALLAAQSAAPQDRELAAEALVAGVMAGEAIPPARLASLAAALPGQPIAALVLGNQAAVAGDWAKARAAYASVSGGGFDGLRAVLVAAACWGQGDTDAALASLGVGRAGGTNPIFALFAAEIAMAAGHPSQSEPLRAAAMSSLPANNLVLAGLAAELAARRGEFAAAQRMVRAMIGGRPGLALSEPGLMTDLRDLPPFSPLRMIAQVYTAAGFAVGASLANVVDPSDSSGDGGPTGEGLPPAALRDLTRIAGHDELLRLRLATAVLPGFAPARIAAAEVLAEAGQTGAALADLARVDAHAPLAPAAQWTAADIDSDLGHTDQARAIAQSLADRFPDRPEPQELFGDIALHAHAYDEAASDYRRAVDLEARLATRPSETFGDVTPASRTGNGRGVGQDANTDAGVDWSLLASLGAALEQAGRWPQARTVLERALALSPDRPMLLNFLGYGTLEHDPGDPRAVAVARMRLERAVSVSPDDPNIRDSLGYALLLQHAPRQALTLFEQAAEKMPEDPVINGHLGDAYMALGKRVEAVEQWQWALLCNPEPEDAIALRRKLRDAGAATDVAESTGVPASPAR